MKRFKYFCFFTAFLISAQNASGNMPTIDIAGVSESLKSRMATASEYAKNIKRHIENISRYQEMIDYQSKQLAQKLGISEITSVVLAAEALYSDIGDLGDTIANTQAMLKEDFFHGGMIKHGKSTMKKMGLNDYCSNYRSLNRQKICYGEVEATFGDMDELEKANASFFAELEQAKVVKNKMATAQTEKEKAEAANLLARQNNNLAAIEGRRQISDDLRKKKEAKLAAAKAQLEAESHKQQFSKESNRLGKIDPHVRVVYR